jgi:hypothetical protein
MRKTTIAGVLVALMAGSAAAEDAFRLRYEIYIGGIKAGSFDADIAVTPARYRVALEGRAEGFVNWITRFESRVVSEGLADFTPERHTVRSQMRGNARSVDLAFAPGRPVEATVVPPSDRDDRDPVPPDMTIGSVDPTTGITAAVFRAATRGCDQSLKLFDGRRRFDVALKDHGIEALRPVDIAVVSGEARKCGFRVETVAGGWKRASEWNDPADRGREYFAWIAPLWAGGPNLPVRIEAEGMFGWLVVHLMQVNGRPPPGTTVKPS